MVKPRLLIVSGLSGAGKSLVLSFLEDNGFYCVDNLPSMLLHGLVEQLALASPPILRAAVAIDSRESAFGPDNLHILERLSTLGTPYEILFLECGEGALEQRFRETRRRHPLAKDGELHAGILRERELLAPLKERAHIVIDTSTFTPLMLYKQLDACLALEKDARMTLLFTSFGFKRGLPMDADLVLDMRFLKNPFYIEALRPLSGLDAPVRAYLEEDAAPFFDAVEHMLLCALPGYAQQNKQRVMVAFGCTGGRHRSVMAAAEMAGRFMGAPYVVRCSHRDLQIEAAHIQTRFSS